ncbi:MAG TPA: acyl-CoA dehydrogenase [Streptosporangiaceae bacterium]|jgi:alkylation response protein AidB-like acyl-CoA dehydrogenase
MAIGLTDEHEALAASVRGWAERNAGSGVTRAAMAADDETRPPFWTGLAEQGLLGLHIPEGYGGQGFGLVELAVAIEELGRAVAPGPFLPTVLAGAAILAAGGAEKARGELLPGLADGSRTAAVSLATGLTARRTPDGLVIDGDVRPVLGAATADLLVLPVGTDRGEEWVAVDAADVAVEPLPSLDRTRRVAAVTAHDVTVPEWRVLDGLASTEVLNLAAVLFGAEAAGIAGWCVDTAAAYARVREQFGRPIGQFQGIKHLCARMLISLEQARAVVWDAARAFDEGSEESAFAAGVAGMLAPDTAVRCGADCVQVHGGIGYTYEHDAHLYYRRALTLRALLGDSSQWSSMVGGQAASGVRRSVKLDLGEDAEPVRDAIRAEIAEIAAVSGAERRERVVAAGLVQPHLPKPWGRAASPLEQVIIQQEMRAAGVRAPNLIIGAWVVPSLVQYGTEEQKQRFLPDTFSGKINWCQLFSEPGAGSDLASLTMRAERDTGGWRLSGQKVWTSVARQADWGICLARTDTSKPKHDGITYFLVDMKAPGVEVRPLTEMTGEQLFNEVFLDDVFVPDELVVGAVNDGWRVARNTLSNERVALSSGENSGLGVKELLDVARSKDALEPAEQERVGALVCEGQSLALLAHRVTLKQLGGTEPGATSSVRKLLGMWHAQHVAEEAWTLLGPSGAIEGGPGFPAYWPKAVLATRAMTIYGGTTEVQLNIIGERILGLPRDPEPGK